MIVVARRKSRFGEVRILRDRRNGSHMYSTGDWYQSHADRDGVSLAGYIHAIYGLTLQAGARRILVIGSAGGTLGTMLARAGRRVTMVDIDPCAFVLARKYFALAPGIGCVVGDGRAFLDSRSAAYDAIVVDAYCREAVPVRLCSVEFFRTARRRLDASGILLFNMMVAHDLDPAADRVAAGMVQGGFAVRVLDTPGETDRNAIVAAGNVARLARPRLLVRPREMADDLKAELGGMAFRERRRAGAIRDRDGRGAVAAPVAACS